MTKILLNLDDKLHSLLWNTKEELAIFKSRNVSWEEFIIRSILGKKVWMKREKFSVRG